MQRRTMVIGAALAAGLVLGPIGIVSAQWHDDWPDHGPGSYPACDWDDQGMGPGMMGPGMGSYPGAYPGCDWDDQVMMPYPHD